MADVCNIITSFCCIEHYYVCGKVVTQEKMIKTPSRITLDNYDSEGNFVPFKRTIYFSNEDASREKIFETTINHDDLGGEASRTDFDLCEEDWCGFQFVDEYQFGLVEFELKNKIIHQLAAYRYISDWEVKEEESFIVWRIEGQWYQKKMCYDMVDPRHVRLLTLHEFQNEDCQMLGVVFSKPKYVHILVQKSSISSSQGDLGIWADEVAREINLPQNTRSIYIGFL